jgi:hypothetical protein
VELGHDPDDAIRLVRTARPGAIETAAQERHVRAARSRGKPAPCTSSEAVRDRAVGAMMGLAVGDALGTTLEFRPRDSYEPLTGNDGRIGPVRCSASGAPCFLRRPVCSGELCKSATNFRKPAPAASAFRGLRMTEASGAARFFESAPSCAVCQSDR